jgi:AraC-like DNA-binding protein
MISYAAIMAVLFIGVGIYMSNSYLTTIRGNMVESNINKLGRIRYQHEENLTTLLSVGREIGLSPYIKPFRLMEEPMRAYHLKMQLLPYTMTNDFPDQLYLIFNEDNYLYSSATSAGLEMFLEKLILFENTPPETLRAALRMQGNDMTVFPAQNVSGALADSVNNRMVAVIAPVSVGDRYSTGNILFLISESTYQRMFADEIYEPRSTYIFYGDQILAASRGLQVPDDIILGEVRENQDTLVKDLSLDGRQYLLTAQRGLKYNMQYATLIPMETVWAGMSRAQWGLGLFLLALSIPCMLLTFYFSRRHARPIKELRYLFKTAASVKDDFEAIHDGIEALVDRNEDLNTRLDQSLPVRRASFIRDFVKGRYPLRQDAVNAAGLLNMDIDKTCYVAVLIGAPARDGSEPNMDRIMTHIGEGVTGYGAELFALEQFLFVFFADSADALETWAWRALSDLQASEAGVAVALSNVHKEFAHAGNAYLEASTAYDNRFVMGNARVLRFSDVGAAAKDIVPFTRSYLEGFRNALRAGDERALSDRMDELFHYLGSTEMSLFAFRMIYNNVIGAMLSEHFDRLGGDMDAFKYYDIFTLSGCRSIADLDDLLRKLCRDILSQREPESTQKHSVIRDIIGYMGEHYADPALSMSAIADAYGISAVRLSLDFKERSGMTPSEYLFLLRMEKAKEMLAETKLSVKDIGLSVGYYDASGFIRRFRRYMAMTPAQYRQTMGHKEEPSKDTGL